MASEDAVQTTINPITLRMYTSKQSHLTLSLNWGNYEEEFPQTKQTKQKQRQNQMLLSSQNFMKIGLF